MKNYFNPFAICEQTLAEEIRRLPEVSGFFSSVEAHVLAVSEEDFASKLESGISCTLGQGVVVSCTGTAGTPQCIDGVLSDVAQIKVEIKGSILMADGNPEPATTIAAAILRSVVGASFEDPFSAEPVKFSGLSIADFEDFTRVVTLSLEARILLNK